MKLLTKEVEKDFDLYEKCADASVKAEVGLSIHEQFKNSIFSDSLPHLFDGAKITKAEKIEDRIYLTL